MIFREWFLAEAKRDDHFFDYTSLTNNAWNDKLKEAKNLFHVSFNTENDDKVAQRTVTVHQKQWDFTDCKFRCEMRMACGDWESSVVYFRCQIVEGFAFGLSKYSNSMFCFIPVKGQGNDHLVKTKNGWSAPDADGKKSEQSRPNQKKCWESLKQYLTALVQKEIKKVRSEL